MNFSGTDFVSPYLEAIRRKQREEQELAQLAPAGIPKGGGRPSGFNAAKFGAYMPDGGSNEIAGGNYGNPVNQHPHGRRGAYYDLKTGRAQPGGGVYEAAIRGLLDKRESPHYGGTNEEMRRWYAQNPWALGR